MAWSNADFLVGQRFYGVVGSHQHKKKSDPSWPQFLHATHPCYPTHGCINPTAPRLISGCAVGIRSCEFAPFGPPTTPRSPPGRRASRACAHLGKGTWHIWWDPATAAQGKKTWMTCCWCPVSCAALKASFQTLNFTNNMPETPHKHPQAMQKPSKSTGPSGAADRASPGCNSPRLASLAASPPRRSGAAAVPAVRPPGSCRRRRPVDGLCWMTPEQGPLRLWRPACCQLYVEDETKQRWGMEMKLHRNEIDELIKVNDVETKCIRDLDPVVFLHSTIHCHSKSADDMSMLPHLLGDLVNEGRSKGRPKSGHAQGGLHVTLSIVPNENGLQAGPPTQVIGRTPYRVKTSAKRGKQANNIRFFQHAKPQQRVNYLDMFVPQTAATVKFMPLAHIITLQTLSVKLCPLTVQLCCFCVSAGQRKTIRITRPTLAWPKSLPRTSAQFFSLVLPNFRKSPRSAGSRSRSRPYCEPHVVRILIGSVGSGAHKVPHAIQTEREGASKNKLDCTNFPVPAFKVNSPSTKAILFSHPSKFPGHPTGGRHLQKSQLLRPCREQPHLGRLGTQLRPSRHFQHELHRARVDLLAIPSLVHPTTARTTGTLDGVIHVGEDPQRQPAGWCTSEYPTYICHEESFHELLRPLLGLVYVERSCVFL